MSCLDSALVQVAVKKGEQEEYWTCYFAVVYCELMGRVCAATAMQFPSPKHGDPLVPSAVYRRLRF